MVHMMVIVLLRLKLSIVNWDVFSKLDWNLFQNLWDFVKKSPLASSETKNYLQVTIICLQSIEWSYPYVYI